MIDVKECRKCGVLKPFTEFYEHPQMADGRVNQCKPCVRAAVRANRKTRADYYREYDRNRGARVFDAKKTRARQLLNQQIYKVTIRVPLRCEDCGTTEAKIEGHHTDYDKPYFVVWVCKACHTERHRAGD